MPAASQTCRSCGAPIQWRRHATTGRLAPIDAVPSPDGNVALCPGGERYVIVSRNERGVRGQPLYTNHFATCPQSRGWRDRGKEVTA